MVNPHKWSVFFSMGLRQWIGKNLQKNLGKFQDVEWSTLFGITTWMIWQWRNKEIFDEEVELHGDPVVVILCRDREVLKARECEGQLRPCKPVREERFIGWDFPPD